MDYIVNVDGISCHVSVKNVKYLAIKVLPPQGEVRVSAPMGCGRKRVEDFLFLKRSWIRKKQAEIQALAFENEPELVEMAPHPVWGKTHFLRIHAGAEADRVVCQSHWLHIHVRGAGEKLRINAILEAWRKIELRIAAGKKISLWRKRMGLPEIALAARKMKSRWGSCHCHKNSITLNTELVKKAPECLEYVVAHELAHFFVPNHGGEFYALLDRLLPDWRERRNLLR